MAYLLRTIDVLLLRTQLRKQITDSDFTIRRLQAELNACRESLANSIQMNLELQKDVKSKKKVKSSKMVKRDEAKR